MPRPSSKEPLRLLALRLLTADKHARQICLMSGREHAALGSVGDGIIAVAPAAVATATVATPTLL